MKLPEDVRQLLARRFQSKHRSWLAGESGENQWPLKIALGVPTEQAALRQVEGVRVWVSAWQHWHGPGALSWCERRWKTLGVQRVPDTLILNGPDEVAQWIGEGTRWKQAQSRYQTLIARWPLLARPLRKYFDVLADYGDADFRRMADMLAWIASHPNSGLYPASCPCRVWTANGSTDAQAC